MAETNAPKQKVTVTVSQLLADLANGVDRAAQAKKYGLSKKQIAAIYRSNTKLHNKKVLRPLSESVELIDDTDEKGKPIAATESGDTNEDATTEASTSTEAEATPAAVNAIGETW